MDDPTVFRTERSEYDYLNAANWLQEASEANIDIPDGIPMSELNVFYSYEIKGNEVVPISQSDALNPYRADFSVSNDAVTPVNQVPAVGSEFTP